MDYAAQAIKAQKSIHSSGGAVQLQQQGKGTYDGVARTRVPGTPVTTDLIAVVVETDKAQANAFLAGTTVYSRMRDLLIAGLDVPNGFDIGIDKFFFEGAEWRIVTFELLCPDNVNKILYTVTVAA